MKKNNIYVEFVVGDWLGFPVICVHTIPVRLVSTKVQAVQPTATLQPFPVRNVNLNEGKRVCGQSQKSARLALKARKQAK